MGTPPYPCSPRALWHLPPVLCVPLLGRMHEPKLLSQACITLCNRGLLLAGSCMAPSLQPRALTPSRLHPRVTGRHRTHERWTKYDILRLPLPKPDEPVRCEMESVHEIAPALYLISPEAVVAWDEAPDGGGWLDDAIQQHMDSADAMRPRCVTCRVHARAGFAGAHKTGPIIQPSIKSPRCPSHNFLVPREGLCRHLNEISASQVLSDAG